MKPWPEPFDQAKQTLASYLGNVAELNYERARAEAAIERLRVAVEALKLIGSGGHCVGSVLASAANNAIAKIGEMPA